MSQSLPTHNLLVPAADYAQLDRVVSPVARHSDASGETRVSHMRRVIVTPQAMCTKR